MLMNLNILRRKIDILDAKIVRLLNERARIATIIGEEKRKKNIKVRDTSREMQVLKRVTILNKGPLPDKLLEWIYKRIINACSKVQKDGNCE